MSEKMTTGNGTEQAVPGLSSKEPAEGGRDTVEKALEKMPGGAHPENAAGAAKATEENDLTTGHSTPGDGGDDNAN